MKHQIAVWIVVIVMLLITPEVTTTTWSVEGRRTGEKGKIDEWHKNDQEDREFFNKQLVIYEFVEVRPNLRTQGKDLGIDDIANYGFNAVRIEVGTAMSVWSGGQHAGDHNTQRYATGKANGKFDLSKPDTEWLDALRLWGEECEKRGIHFMVDLFDGCNVKHRSSKCNDPFYACLNVNGIIAKDGDIREEMFNVHPSILQYQYKRIDMVCDALRGLKNVIIELANEAGGSQVVNWRRKMIEYILPRYNVRLCTNPHWNESDEFNLDYVAIHNRMDMKRAYKAIDELNRNGRDNLPGKVIISSDSPGWDDTAQLYGFIYNVLKAGGSFALLPYQGDWQQRLEIMKKVVQDVENEVRSEVKVKEAVENVSEVAYKISIEDGISGTAHFGRPEGGISKIWSAWQYGRQWVKVYDSQGKMRWSRELNGPARATDLAEVPATWWDINSDGKDEIVVGRYWLDDNGTVLKDPKSFPVIEHADGVWVTDKLDGDMTVVCSWQTTNKIIAYRPDAKIKWVYPSHEILTTVERADQLILLDSKGNEIWRKRDQAFSDQCSLVDWTVDDSFEILTPKGILDGDGSLIRDRSSEPRWPGHGNRYPWLSARFAADLTGDGREEYLYRDDEYIYVVRNPEPGNKPSPWESLEYRLRRANMTIH